ncbi:MAG: hypothetical protein SH859_00970 [Hyphomicrobium aestuarii]|nr:hypothetical protein [Hyphomicrobium aestuarii]
MPCLKSALKRAMRSFGLAICLVLFAAPVQITSANADTIPFWEEQPSLTGKAPRAAKRLRAAAASEAGAARPTKRRAKR